KRICYIHVGPHKTGTSAIQWFLQENRAELLEHGYFVPESETKRGAHHALAEKLAGMEVGEHREPLVAKSIRALGETPAETIVISSEALEGILESRKHAQVFFRDRKSTRLNSSHVAISYAVFCLKKKKKSIWYRSIQRIMSLSSVECEA